jgi:tungstate transport system permease protein
LDLLFTPQAMIIEQTVLVVPIVAAFTRQTIEDLWIEYHDELTAMNIGPATAWRAKSSCSTVAG